MMPKGIVWAVEIEEVAVELMGVEWEHRGQIIEWKPKWCQKAAVDGGGVDGSWVKRHGGARLVNKSNGGWTVVSDRKKAQMMPKGTVWAVEMEEGVDGGWVRAWGGWIGEQKQWWLSENMGGLD